MLSGLLAAASATRTTQRKTRGCVRENTVPFLLIEVELAAPFLSQEFFLEVEEYFTYPFQLILDKLGIQTGAPDSSHWLGYRNQFCY